MLIIWGSRNRVHEEGIINYECIICKEPQIKICSYRRWFTFFFVPIFPTDSKKYFLSCTHCENSYKIKDGVNVAELINESKPYKQQQENN